MHEKNLQNLANPAHGIQPAPDPGVELDKLRYQSFSVDGQHTSGHDRSYLNDVIFGKSAEGRTLLDIGSYLGYFCVEALKRGAQAATGIEPDLESIRQANGLAALSGVKPRYLHGDFEEWDFQAETFDIVLCLNVLHHMFDAVGAISRIKKLARRKIVIEFAAPSFRDLFNRSLSPFAMLSSIFPAVVLGNPKRNTDIAARSYLFTVKAMRVLFDKHTCAFEPVTITKSPFKGRWILEANRRDLGHVAFVVGPTASGKSTVFHRILQDSAYRSSLGLDDDEWRGVHGHEITLPRGRSDRVLVHYDMLRPYRRSIRAYNRDPRCDLLDVAEKVSCITLMTSPVLLRRQILLANDALDPARLPKRHRHLYERYAEEKFFTDWYESWFSYMERHDKKTAANVMLVRWEDGREEVRPVTEWRAIQARFFKA